MCKVGEKDLKSSIRTKGAQQILQKLKIGMLYNMPTINTKLFKINLLQKQPP